MLVTGKGGGEITIGNLKPKKSVVLLFSGKCAKVLLKLIARAEQLTEAKLVITSPEILQPRKRNVTQYSINIEMSKQVQSVNWAPEAIWR